MVDGIGQAGFGGVAAELDWGRLRNLASFGRFSPVLAIWVMLRPDEDSPSDSPVYPVDVLGGKDADRRSTLPAGGARHVAVLRQIQLTNQDGSSQIALPLFTSDVVRASLLTATPGG